MLIELRIQNVAVIDRVSLSLANGLNVLTGETGAGKSLIVGALGMLLGERATADRVRTTADKATVVGVFEFPHDEDDRVRSGIQIALDERGIDAGDELLILKREVSGNGRSRAWINGSPVTATVLAEVGALLVSVHGQHDSRQLLEPEHQRDILDLFANAVTVRQAVAAAHSECASLSAQHKELDERRLQAERRADYLRFVQREIDDARLILGEDETLDGEIRRLSHATELRDVSADAASAISGDEHAALARLGAVRRALATLARIDPDAARWQDAFDSSVLALDELATELLAYAESVDADPERLRTLESRREVVFGLMRKHGPTLAEVIATGARADDELDLVDHGNRELQRITAARADAEGVLRKTSAALTAMRAVAATALSTSVEALLPELGMPDGQFRVALHPLDAISAGGAESVQFQAALNVGGDARPLARIASGGELSRVMLALSTVLARLQDVPTLVFDEIDAGIGGEIAWQVGALMRRVAGHHQVLAISHLAQIAARAHHHIVVRKSAVGTVTTSDTEVVRDDVRVVEIARMLGGDADRAVSRAHARELLERGAESDPVDTTANRAPSPADVGRVATTTSAKRNTRSTQRRG